MSKPSTSSSGTLRALGYATGAACLCLLLSGCPSASNPPKPQESSSPSTPPPTSSAGGAAGSSSGSKQGPTGSGAEGETASGGESAAGEGADTSGSQANGADDSQQTAGAEGNDSSSNAQSGAAAGAEAGTGEPTAGTDESGFGNAPTGAAGLPDLRDEPDSGSADAATGGGVPEAYGEIAGAMPGAVPGTNAGTAGSNDENSPYGTGGAYGSDNPEGALTPGEQIAILDAELARGAGEFDEIIMQTETQQREAAREQAPPPATGSGSAGYGSENADADSPYGGGIASAGGYGGGLGGASGGPPQNTAKYPPPAGIPAGDDDDVVARQLREAAMREPDPAIREKLWNEYRKYKGIHKINQEAIDAIDQKGAFLEAAFYACVEVWFKDIFESHHK